MVSSVYVPPIHGSNSSHWWFLLFCLLSEDNILKKKTDVLAGDQSFHFGLNPLSSLSIQLALVCPSLFTANLNGWHSSELIQHQGKNFSFLQACRYIPINGMLVKLTKLPMHREDVHVVVLFKVTCQQLHSVVTSFQAFFILMDLLHLSNKINLPLLNSLQ